MRTEQLALLVALVVLANVALLGALVLPRLQRGRATDAVVQAAERPARGGADALVRPGAATGTLAAYEADLAPASRQAYERVVRVVSYLFLGSALGVVTVAGGPGQPVV